MRASVTRMLRATTAPPRRVGAAVRLLVIVLAIAVAGVRSRPVETGEATRSGGASIAALLHVGALVSAIRDARPALQRGLAGRVVLEGHGAAPFVSGAALPPVHGVSAVAQAVATGSIGLTFEATHPPARLCPKPLARGPPRSAA